MAKKDFVDVKVERRGESIILPEGMTNKKGIEWLQLREAEDQRVVDVHEFIPGFPLDCAHALQEAVYQRYGFKDLRTTPGFFSDTPPAFVNVPIDHTGKAVEVFVGRFGIPKFERSSYLETTPDGHNGLWVTGEIRHKEMPELKKLIELTRKLLEEKSLYRGKAFNLKWSADPKKPGFETPTFMPPLPGNVKLLVNDGAQFIIDTSILALIKKAARARAMGTPLKRTILCEGAYGTGKTLLAGAIADLAPLYGWTFIYLHDVTKLPEAYKLATRYGNVVLFAEDLDQAVKGSREEVHKVLNAIDGVDTKGSEIMLILTTNHVEELPEGMRRPGRIDVILPFRAPDSKTAAKVVEMYAGKYLAPGTSLVSVGEKLNGRIPVVIREVVERAKLHALAEIADDQEIVLDEVGLLAAADAMNYHLAMLDAQMPKPPASVIEQFASEIGRWFVYAMDRSTQTTNKDQRETFNNGRSNAPVYEASLKAITERK